MSNNNIEDLEAEITMMQKAEERLEYIKAVHQIIDAYNIASSVIASTPINIRPDSEKNHIADQLFLEPEGLKLGEFEIKIAQNEYLKVNKATETIFIFSKEQIIGDKKFIIELANKISDLITKFQNEIETKIAKEKQRLIEKIRNF